MKFDDIFQHFGHFGRYQLMVYVLTVGPFIIGDPIGYNYIGASVGHWCLVPELKNLTHEQQRELAIPRGADGDYEQCLMYNISYRETDGRPPNSTDTRGCTHGWVYDRSRFTETIVSEFDLVCEKKAFAPLPAAIHYGGAIVGTLVSGVLSDRFGRTRVLVLLRLTLFCGGVLATFSPTFWVFCTAKFIIGACTSASYLNGFIIMLEVVGPKARGLAGMVIGLTYSVMFFTTALAGYYLRHFRYLQGTLLAHYLMFGVLVAIFVPEPPRWLIQQNRIEEAGNVFRTLAKVNKMEVPENLDNMLAEIRHHEIKQRQNTPHKILTDMYKSKTMVIRSMAINFQWFTNSLMYFTLSLNAQALAGNLYVNTALLGLVEFPAIIIGYFLVSWRVTGRRYTTAYSMFLAGITSLALLVLLELGASGEAKNVVSLLGKSLITLSYNYVYVISLETFPTEVRTSAMGVANMFAMVGAMAAPYMGEYLMNIWMPLPSLIFGCSAVVFGLFLLVLPETLGLPLCQTLEEANQRTVEGCD